MPYFRRPKNEENPYARIHNGLLEDSDLSFKAKGILCYLLSKSDDWEVYQTQLSGVGPDGETAVRSGLEELIEAGYVHRFQRKDGSGKFGKYLYIICEQPRSNVDAPETWFSDIGESDIGESDTGKSDTTNNENTPTTDNTNNGERDAHARGEPPCTLEEAERIARDEDIHPRLAKEWWHHYNARGWETQIYSVRSALVKWQIQETKMYGDGTGENGGNGTSGTNGFASVEDLMGADLTKEEMDRAISDFPSLSESNFAYKGHDERTNKPMYWLKNKPSE